MLDIHIYDIARIEVLAGPQGTLYGASSEAGTIRIITNKPDTTAFAAGYELGANQVDHGGVGGSIEGFLNVPLSPIAAIRLVAWDEHRAGFINVVPKSYTFPTSGITFSDAPFVKKDANYAFSETPLFAGRAIAGLAADPSLMKKSGRVFSSWNLSDEYGFCDGDGGRPHWGRHVTEKYGDCLKTCGDAFYEHWVGGVMDTIYGDWP